MSYSAFFVAINMPFTTFSIGNRIDSHCQAHPTIPKPNGLEKVNQPEGNLIWVLLVVNFYKTPHQTVLNFILTCHVPFYNSGQFTKFLSNVLVIGTLPRRLLFNVARQVSLERRQI